MKRTGTNYMVLLFLTLLAGFAFSGYAAASEKPTGKPSIYCNVIEKPNPLLMGEWEVSFSRSSEGAGSTDFNIVKYWLVHDGDQYGLYFFRTSHSGRKRYAGWKDWTLNGNEILSDKGMRFFVKDGKVYFSWNDVTPTEMKQVGK